MKKLTTIFSVILFVVVVGYITFSWYSNRQQPKRVLFLTIDTLRADHVSAYGYPLKTTPFFDALTEKGVLFERALSVSSHTAPSHSTMFSGIFPYQHRVLANHDRMSTDLPTLHTALTSAGFKTAAFSAVKFMEGKVGFPDLSEGEDLVGSDVSRRFWFRSAATQVDRAINWLKNKSAKDPFLLWVHFYDVHAWQHADPGQVPPEYFPQFMPEDIEKHADFLITQHGIPEDYYSSKQEMVKRIHRYDARLRYVDDQIKRLAEFMDKQGLWQDTLVVILSDHGEGLGNHGYMGHGMYLYDEQLHVPLLVAMPNGRLTKNRIARQVRTVDLFPTVVELLNLDMPRAVVPYQGRSLKPVILGTKGAEQLLPEYSFAERRPKDGAKLRRYWKDGDFHALQNDEWKIILHTLGEHELYNLKNDKHELNNIVAEHPEILEKFQAKMDALLRLPRAGDLVSEELNEAQIEELRSLGYL